MAENKKIDEKALRQDVQNMVQAQIPGGSVDVATIKEIVNEMLPAMTAAIIAAQKAQQPQVEAKKPKCLECLQPNMACGGRHRQAVVFVSGPYERWFQGVQINGVLYKSPTAGTRITVPADINEGHMMEDFRKAEERFVTARNYEHHSGEISPKSEKGFKKDTGPVHL